MVNLAITKAEKAQQLFSKGGFVVNLDEVKELLEELMGKAKQREYNRVMNHTQAQMLLLCKINNKPCV